MKKLSAEPNSLARALAELIALRGLAKTRARTQLADVWQQVAGERIGGMTHAIELKRGTLLVAVDNAALKSELTGFHQQSLLARLQADQPTLKIRKLKFQLRSRSLDVTADADSCEEPLS